MPYVSLKPVRQQFRALTLSPHWRYDCANASWISPHFLAKSSSSVNGFMVPGECRDLGRVANFVFGIERPSCCPRGVDWWPGFGGIVCIWRLVCLSIGTLTGALSAARLATRLVGEHRKSGNNECLSATGHNPQGVIAWVTTKAMGLCRS
jgi:hypothetical protein